MDVQPVLAQVRPQPVLDSARRPVYPDVRRLLVVRDDRLGDLTLTLPAIERLRAAYPEAVIGLLVAPALAPLAEMFSPVDRVLEAGGDLPRTIRSFGPDAAVCISRRFAAARALRRSGVRRIAGTGRRWFSFLFDRTLVVSRRAGVRHELEHALDLAACAGATPGPVRFSIDVPAAAERDVATWLERNGISGDPIVLHPGTAGSCPGWAARRWRQLAERLRGDGHPVVITEGPADALAMEAFAGCGLPRFAQDLPRLAALLSRARSIAGNSTGPVHLAVALGRPALAVHAPWKSCGAARWGPYHDRGWALVVEHAPARRWSRRRRRRFAARLMDGLGVETVHRAVQSMVASGRPEIGP